MSLRHRIARWLIPTEVDRLSTLETKLSLLRDSHTPAANRVARYLNAAHGEDSYVQLVDDLRSIDQKKHDVPPSLLDIMRGTKQ